MDSRDTERGAGGMVPPDYLMVPEEEFDAYNDDTFGNDAETWTEDHHDELVGAHITEVNKYTYKPSYLALLYKNLEKNKLLIC